MNFGPSKSQGVLFGMYFFLGSKHEEHGERQLNSVQFRQETKITTGIYVIGPLYRIPHIHSKFSPRTMDHGRFSGPS